MTISRTTLLACLLAATTLWMSSCRSGPTIDGDSDSSPKAGQSEKDGEKEKEKKEKEKKKKAYELEDKQLDLELAELELKLARTSTVHSVEDAEEAAMKAKLEHEKAVTALALFNDFDKKKRIDGMQLSVERSQFRIENNEQDLKQMEDDYARTGDEYYAKKTGEIVVWRTKANLDFSRRSHAIALEDQIKLLEHTLPKEAEELTRTVDLKARALDRANVKVETARLKAEMDMIKAETKIAKLKRAIKDLEQELEA